MQNTHTYTHTHTHTHTHTTQVLGVAYMSLHKFQENKSDHLELKLKDRLLSTNHP